MKNKEQIIIGETYSLEALARMGMDRIGKPADDHYLVRVNNAEYVCERVEEGYYTVKFAAHPPEPSTNKQDQDGKEILSVCCISRKIFDPKEWYPLTAEFIKASIDQAYGDGFFESHYVLSHGFCDKYKACAKVKRSLEGVD